MHSRSLLLILVVALIGGFAALNWTAFTTPSQLSLGFVSVDAPIGVVMLGVVGFVTLLFATWVIYLQGSVMLESRRQAKELHAQRELADKAEASRFVELRNFVAAELQRLTQAIDDARIATQNRLAETEERLVRRMDEAGNALAASIGELDDRIERHDAAQGARRADPLLPRA